jgi:uncharacterized membrane protein (DUF4010 family)
VWIVVLLFSGLNFAGYVTRRALGEARGYQMMGALGGLISSTAVTFTFARKSREEPGSGTALAVGTVAACTVLVPRLLGLTLILNPALLGPAAVGISPVFLTGVILLLIGHRKLTGGTPESPPPATHNPLQLWSAVKMAAAFQVVLILLYLVTTRFGSTGVLAGAAILGLTDTDALAFAMNQLANASDMVLLAARALTLGVVVNSVFKAVLAGMLGSPGYRRLAVPGLLALAGAGASGFWLLGRLPLFG